MLEKPSLKDPESDASATKRNKSSIPPPSKRMKIITWIISNTPMLKHKQEEMATYLPKIEYFMSSMVCLLYVIKNCEPLESGPLLAIDTIPLALC